MDMTHYMSLLMDNQPWNLIIFLAIPIILIEAITIMEFFIAYSRKTTGSLVQINKIAIIFIGLYFSGISIYLFTNLVIPLTQNGGWLTWVDIVAVGFYISTALFLLPLVLLELGIILKKKTEEKRLRIRFGLISISIVVFCLIGMIFGAVKPSLISQTTNTNNMEMDNMDGMDMEKDMDNMDGMDMEKDMDNMDGMDMDN
ncbi:DUF6803 family protein [Bacillus sp. B1-b2]|uniref:DUF6803 family protein n=1 Tax=Bacillus sp. B1-b2 TaxID=2653201 RepID=UPI001D00A21E|nr:DUF6803 family protein [Bacillus sp. B1-b2]